MKHFLKIWPQYYEAVSEGVKTFELRENDRGFQKGDRVVLQEWDPVEHQYLKDTQKPDLQFEIGYVLPVDSERVVFSLLELSDEDD